MRNASGQANHYAGTVGCFTIKASAVNMKVCEQSWSFDAWEKEKNPDFRVSSGLAAVVTGKSKMELRMAAENCDTYLIRESGYARQFDRYDNSDKYLAYLWGE